MADEKKTLDQLTADAVAAYERQYPGQTLSAKDVKDMREDIQRRQQEEAQASASRANMIDIGVKTAVTATYAYDGGQIAKTSQQTARAALNATATTALRETAETGAGVVAKAAFTEAAEATAGAAARTGMRAGLRTVPVVGNVVVGVGEAGYAAYKGDTKGVGEGLGGALGAAFGAAAAGAAVGTIVPGAGTAVGFVVGAIGGAVGYWLGSKGGGAAAEGLSEHFNERAAGVGAAPARAVAGPSAPQQEQGFFAKLGF